MQFGIGLIGAYAAGDLVDLVRTADELGFHTCHLIDDPSMRHSWVTAGVAQRTTAPGLHVGSTGSPRPIEDHCLKTNGRT